MADIDPSELFDPITVLSGEIAHLTATHVAQAAGKTAAHAAFLEVNSTLIDTEQRLRDRTTEVYGYVRNQAATGDLTGEALVDVVGRLTKSIDSPAQTKAYKQSLALRQEFKPGALVLLLGYDNAIFITVGDLEEGHPAGVPTLKSLPSHITSPAQEPLILQFTVPIIDTIAVKSLTLSPANCIAGTENIREWANGEADAESRSVLDNNKRLERISRLATVFGKIGDVEQASHYKTRSINLATKIIDDNLHDKRSYYREALSFLQNVDPIKVQEIYDQQAANFASNHINWDISQYLTFLDHYLAAVNSSSEQLSTPELNTRLLSMLAEFHDRGQKILQEKATQQAEVSSTT